MATTARSRTPAKKAGAGADGAPEAALDRLNASLDAAEDAAKALRKHMRRGTRDMARNVETMIASTRRDTRKLGKAVKSDLADLQKAVTSPPARGRAKAGPKRARSAATTRKTTSRKTPASKA